jgi:hypothetical protein
MYVNHCQFWPDSPPDVGWINMVREPVDLAASSYYYSVDAEARHSEKAALDALEERKSSGSCGCYKLEFDACVRQRAQHNCTDFVGRDGLMVHATDFFCEHRHNEAHCRLGAGPDASAQTRLEARTQLGLATANVRDKYFFVGLTEEFVRSVNVLEALLPKWFAGASEELGKMARMKELTLHNPLTGTNMSGCVSDEARDLPEPFTRTLTRTRTRTRTPTRTPTLTRHETCSRRTSLPAPRSLSSMRRSSRPSGSDTPLWRISSRTSSM